MTAHFPVLVQALQLRVGAKLSVWAQTSPLSEMMLSYKNK